MAAIPSSAGRLKLLDFQPFYTPKEVLELGAFGGSFFKGLSQFAKYRNTEISDIAETKYFRLLPEVNENYFKVFPDQAFFSADILEPIVKRHHPLGWFDFYCDYYYFGKSNLSLETISQRVAQWKRMIRNMEFYINKAAYSGNSNRWADLTFMKKEKQQLLELGWDPTKNPATMLY